MSFTDYIIKPTEWETKDWNSTHVDDGLIKTSALFVARRLHAAPTEVMVLATVVQCAANSALEITVAALYLVGSPLCFTVNIFRLRLSDEGFLNAAFGHSFVAIHELYKTALFALVTIPTVIVPYSAVALLNYFDMNNAPTNVRLKNFEIVKLAHSADRTIDLDRAISYVATVTSAIDITTHFQPLVDAKIITKAEKDAAIKAFNTLETFIKLSELISEYTDKSLESLLKFQEKWNSFEASKADLIAAGFYSQENFEDINRVLETAISDKNVERPFIGVSHGIIQFLKEREKVTKPQLQPLLVNEKTLQEKFSDSYRKAGELVVYLWG